jgi:hypothetical protein
MAKTWLQQAGGYMALAILTYEWLGIADRSVWQVLLSALLGLVILFGAVWLIGGALAGAAGWPLRRMGRVALWVLAIAAVIGCAMWLGNFRARVGLSVASQLTQWFRHPVKPQAMGALYGWLLWIAAVAGVLSLLPFASRAARGETSGRPWREWRYWAACGLLAAAGYWLPGLLAGWVPGFKGFGMQTASMIVRFMLAYLVALAAWLAIAWLARGSRSAATA